VFGFDLFRGICSGGEVFCFAVIFGFSPTTEMLRRVYGYMDFSDDDGRTLVSWLLIYFDTIHTNSVWKCCIVRLGTWISPTTMEGHL